MSDKKGCPLDGEDVVLLGPPTGDGGIIAIHHREDHTSITGILRPLEDGKSIDGDIVRLTPKENGIGFKQEVLYENPSKSGPAMVNNQDFRDGWSRIFGNKTAIGQA